MLQSIHSIVGAEASAVDGPIGTVFDFFFDDEVWCVRYIVIDTGTWLTSEKILLAIESVDAVDAGTAAVHIKHPRRLIELSPRINLARPVTHFEENMVRRHYGAWPHWAPYLIGAGPHKLSTLRDKAGEHLDEREHIPTYALHSLHDPNALQVQFREDAKEKLVDFMIDPATWEIRQFVVRRRVAGGRKPFAIDRDQLVSFDRETLELNVDLDIDAATPLDAESPAL